MQQVSAGAPKAQVTEPPTDVEELLDPIAVIVAFVAPGCVEGPIPDKAPGPVLPVAHCGLAVPAVGARLEPQVIHLKGGWRERTGDRPQPVLARLFGETGADRVPRQRGGRRVHAQIRRVRALEVVVGLALRGDDRLRRASYRTSHEAPFERPPPLLPFVTP